MMSNDAQSWWAQPAPGGFKFWSLESLNCAGSGRREEGGWETAAPVSPLQHCTTTILNQWKTTKGRPPSASPTLLREGWFGLSFAKVRTTPPFRGFKRCHKTVLNKSLKDSARPCFRGELNETFPRSCWCQNIYEQLEERSWNAETVDP